MEEKHFVKIVTSLATVLLKMTLCFYVYTLYLQKNIILSLFKTDALNFG